MYKLYYYPNNANLAPHVVLEETGVPYELELIDRERNAHKSAAYLALNPRGLIPVLVDGDLVLHEAAAICLHLADKHPEARLAPPLASDERAQFYKWLVFLTNTVQAELSTYYYPERLVDDAEAAAVVKAHAERRVGSMLDILEAALAHGPYLLGERYSAADPYLMMLARWTRPMQRPAGTLPNLRRFLQAVVERPAVRRAFEQEGIAAPYY